jgi:integrase
MFKVGVLRNNQRNIMAKYVDLSNGIYLLNKRLASRLGHFPGFKEKIRRKLDVHTLAEAEVEAARMVAAIELLQRVCLRDSKGLTNSIKDMSKSAQTWLWWCDHDLEEVKAAEGRHTEKAQSALESHSFLIGEVTEFFGERRYDHEGGEVHHLSEFGDYLLGLLKHGSQRTMFSDALTPYLERTNRSHLSENHPSVRNVARSINAFVSLIGDKPLEHLSRRDVEKYIAKRITEVKTASISRELTSLRAAWDKAAKAADIRLQNPFSDPVIKGFGTDSVPRATPPLEAVIELLKKLEADESKASYVVPVIAVTALTGLRLGETAGLMETDYDKEKQILFIRPNGRRGRLKTSNSTRPFPVLPELEVWLDRLFLATPAGSSNAASATGLKKLKKLGFDYMLHGLRHSFKQRLVETNANAILINELLGWSIQGMAANYGYNAVTAMKIDAVKSVYSTLMPKNDTGNVYQFKAP